MLPVRRTAHHARPIRLGALPLALALASSGCTGLTAQLHPTDVEALDQLEDREAREQALAENTIYAVDDARGTRYVKGERIGARPRSWQSLDLVLRSDRNSAAALPEKKVRAARVLTGMLVASALVTIGVWVPALTTRSWMRSGSPGRPSAMSRRLSASSK